MAKRGPKPKNNEEKMENNTEITPENTEIKTEKPIKDDELLPKKSLFRVDEAAEYFGVTERTIHLWIEHGHLQKEKIVGIARIPRDSILNCRFKRVAISRPIL